MIGKLARRLKQKELYNGYYHFIRRKLNFKRKRSLSNYLNNLRKNIQEKMFNREQIISYTQKVINLKGSSNIYKSPQK